MTDRIHFYPSLSGRYWCWETDAQRRQRRDELAALWRLRQAAPAMLEALQRVEDNWDNLSPQDRQQVRTAIAAAKENA